MAVSETNAAPIGVLLLQMGGPHDLASIKPFLTELFMDPLLMPLPGPMSLRGALAGFLASRRARRVAERYRAIGGGSPLARITQEQAMSLQTWLGANGIDALVRPIMRYCAPRADETLAELTGKGVTKIVAFSLYPHYSRTTTGSSMADLRRSLARHASMKIEVIDRWGDEPSYVDLVSRWIRREVQILWGEVGNHVEVVLSAHGLPQKLIKQGDPYLAEVMGTLNLIQKETGLACRLGFQSRLGPMRWLEPETGAVIDELAAGGAKGLVLAPISFVSDNIESLYDMDIIYRGRAAAAGITHFRRLPTFNANPDFINFLGNLVRRTLRFGPTASGHYTSASLQ